MRRWGWMKPASAACGRSRKQISNFHVISNTILFYWTLLISFYCQVFKSLHCNRDSISFGRRRQNFYTGYNQVIRVYSAFAFDQINFVSNCTWNWLFGDFLSVYSDLVLVKSCLDLIPRDSYSSLKHQIGPEWLNIDPDYCFLIKLVQVTEFVSRILKQWKSGI